MASKQNGVVPGNVIDFHFTDDVEKDSENLNNLMRDGSMLLVRRYPFNDGYSFTRYDPSNLIFMRFDFSNTSMGEWVKTENPTDTVVEQYHNGEHVPFFVKGSDLFYHKETKEVFLKCEEDWYQVDFTNEKHFALNNNLSITLHNLVTDEVKTLGEMRAWEVVDSDYEPFSSKFLGATDLNTDYMDNFATGDNMYVPSTPGAGKPHSILDMINGTEPSSDEEVESSGFEIKAPLHKYLLGYPVEQIEQLVSNSHKVLSEQVGRFYSLEIIEKILDEIDKIALSKKYEFISASLTENINDEDQLDFIFTLVETEKFYIEKINSPSKNPLYGINSIKSFSETEKWMIISEGRKEPMNWIICIPKGFK